MLQLTIELSPEGWDEAKEEFVDGKSQTIQLEHSLVSLSKWESKWCKPFLSQSERTIEETIDYIRCMTITQNVKPEVYNHLSNKNIEEVNAYIQNPMTATWFTEDKMTKGRPNSEQTTNELIYYWMIVNNIPKECEKWHLNRLLTLIRICHVKNNPDKKMSKRETAAYYAALNAQRKKKFNTKG